MKLYPWIQHILIAFPAGLALGLIYFSGLYWTVNKITTMDRRYLFLVGSYLIRVIVILFGFYLVSGIHWQRFLLCLLGFLTARIILINRWKPRGPGIPVRFKKDVVS